jgi:exopolyphosphatase/pppGpp-phosphohydrolase
MYVSNYFRIGESEILPISAITFLIPYFHQQEDNKQKLKEVTQANSSKLESNPVC